MEHARSVHTYSLHLAVCEREATIEIRNQGREVTTIPIGMGVDGAGYDPASGNAFASNADGTLTVIHQDSADKYRVAQTVETPQGSRNMGLDPMNHHLYVVSAKFGPVPPGGRRGPVISGSFAVLVIEQ